jgi:hypothetical protein
MTSETNAFAVVFRKDPSQLTRADAMTVGITVGPEGLTWCRGSMPTFKAAGMEGRFVDGWMMPHPEPGRTGWMEVPFMQHLDDAVSRTLERLSLLWLEIVRETGKDAASELELAGIWFSISIAISGRSAVAMVLIDRAD